MIAELADGKKLRFPDDMPDEMMDAHVMQHIQMGRLADSLAALAEALQANTRQMADLAAAYRAPREIKVKRDFKDEKVTGATSTVKH